jgi:hypothetical protein
MFYNEHLVFQTWSSLNSPMINSNSNGDKNYVNLLVNPRKVTR